MFPQFGAGNSSAATTRPSLVSFKAGKMKHEEKAGGTYLVTPEVQKGLISLVRGDDQLIHFQWSNRHVSTPVDDFIIFPHDCAFSKVNTGRAQDRVYLLQYQNSARRFFFWMQDKKSEQDESNATKLNNMMNNPPQANAAPSGTTAGVGPNGQMDQNALLQMLGVVPGSSPAPAGTTNGSTNAPAVVQMSDLQHILQNMGMAPTPVEGPAAADPSSSSTSGTTTPSTATNNKHETEEELLLRRAIEESMKDNDDDSGEAGDNDGSSTDHAHDHEASGTS